MSFSEFLHMGGYGFYVWTSYGITALVLVVNIVLPWQRHKQLRQQIARKLKREAQQS